MPGFLGTLGMPLVAGREIAWNDTYKKIPVAMISENVARELWNDPSAALGKRIRVSTKDDWREIIGVVGDVYDDGVAKPATTSVYWPLMMDHFESDDSFAFRDVAFVLRSSRTGSESFLNEVRQAVWSLNPNLPLAEVHALDFFYKRSLARTSFTLVMLGVAGCMASSPIRSPSARARSAFGWPSARSSPLSPACSSATACSSPASVSPADS